MNKCVEQFVNSTGQFPDFCDILDLMKKTNIDEDLKIPEYQIEEMGILLFYNSVK